MLTVYPLQIICIVPLHHYKSTKMSKNLAKDAESFADTCFANWNFVLKWCVTLLLCTYLCGQLFALWNASDGLMATVYNVLFRLVRSLRYTGSRKCFLATNLFGTKYISVYTCLVAGHLLISAWMECFLFFFFKLR